MHDPVETVEPWRRRTKPPATECTPHSRGQLARLDGREWQILDQPESRKPRRPHALLVAVADAWDQDRGRPGPKHFTYGVVPGRAHHHVGGGDGAIEPGEEWRDRHTLGRHRAQSALRVVGHERTGDDE